MNPLVLAKPVEINYLLPAATARNPSDILLTDTQAGRQWVMGAMGVIAQRYGMRTEF